MKRRDLKKRIRKRAHEIWEHRQEYNTAGNATSDWLYAEAEIERDGRFKDGKI